MLTAKRLPQSLGTSWLPWVTLALTLSLQCGGAGGRVLPGMLGPQGAPLPGQGGVIPGYNVDSVQHSHVRPTAENQVEATGVTNHDVNVAPLFHTLPGSIPQQQQQQQQPTPTARGTSSSPRVPGLQLPTPPTRTLPPALGPQGLSQPSGQGKGRGRTMSAGVVTRPPWTRPQGKSHAPRGQGHGEETSPSPPGVREGVGGEPTAARPRAGIPTSAVHEGSEPGHRSTASQPVDQEHAEGGTGSSVVNGEGRTGSARGETTSSSSPTSRRPPGTGESTARLEAASTTKPSDERGGLGQRSPGPWGSAVTPRRPWKPWPTVPASSMVRGAAGRGPPFRGSNATVPSRQANASNAPSSEQRVGSVSETVPTSPEPTPAASAASPNRTSPAEESVTRVAVEPTHAQSGTSEQENHHVRVGVGNATAPQEHVPPQRGAAGFENGSQPDGNLTEGRGEGGAHNAVPLVTKTSKEDVQKATTLAAASQGAGTEHSKLEMGTDYISGIFPTYEVLRPSATLREAVLETEGSHSSLSTESSRFVSTSLSGSLEQTTAVDLFSSQRETSEMYLPDSSLVRSSIPEPTPTLSLFPSRNTALSAGENSESPSSVAVSPTTPLHSSVEWSVMLDKLLSEKLMGKSQKPSSGSESAESEFHWSELGASDSHLDLFVASSGSSISTSADLHTSFRSEIAATPVFDGESSLEEQTRPSTFPGTSLGILPTATLSWGRATSMSSLISDLPSYLVSPVSRAVLEPTLSSHAQSIAVPASSSNPASESTTGSEASVSFLAPSGVSPGVETSTRMAGISAPPVSRLPPEGGVTSPSPAHTTGGARLPTGDHEIVLRNNASSSTTTATTATSGSRTASPPPQGPHVTAEGNSPGSSGANTDSWGTSAGVAGYKTNSPRPPTIETPPPAPSDNSSLTAENSTELGGEGRGKHRGEKPPTTKQPDLTGSVSPRLAPGVTPEPREENGTEHSNATASSSPLSSSLSPSFSSSSVEAITNAASASSIQEDHSLLSEQGSSNAEWTRLDTATGTCLPASIAPTASSHIGEIASSSEGNAGTRVDSTSLVVPTSSLSESSGQTFRPFASQTVVEPDTTQVPTATRAVSRTSEGVVPSQSVATELPVWTANETSSQDNTTEMDSTSPAVRTLPTPLTPSSPPSPSPSPSSSPSGSSNLSLATTARPSSAGNVTRRANVTVAPLLPRLTSAVVSLPALSTPPPVFVWVKLQMTWSQFCQQQDNFRVELSQVLRQSAVHMATINWTQIVLMNAKAEQCAQKLVPLNQEDQVILLQLYFLDAHGQYDVKLTITSASLIKDGFSLQDASVFKDKLLDVRLSTDRGGGSRGSGPEGAGPGGQGGGSLFPEPGTTIVAVIGTIGAVCCVALVILQALIRRRYGRTVRVYVPRGRHYGSAHSDAIALASVSKCRPHSGLFNPTFNAADLDLTHPINAEGLSRVCQDTELIQEEFQSIPNEAPPLTVVPAGAEDKNRYANVIPIPETRVKLRRRLSQPGSDYINANFITGHQEDGRAYIATQTPLESTTGDLWRMVWEQQSRAILMLTPMGAQGKPQVGHVYWPESETALRRYGDFRVALKKRDVTQEYIHSVLELKEMETNLVREVQHFWLTCWPLQGRPEPLSLVKFVLDTRPSYEDSGAPVVVHCSAGTGRTGVFLATDVCMRQFEARRVVDILNCVYRMRRERAGLVQTRGQYTLIYQALHEYASVLTAPGHQAA